MTNIDVARVRQAADRLAGTIGVTPIEASAGLSEISGQDVWLKCENLQVTGSFKVRGAFFRISELSAEQRQAGVVAASAGNHAQGVALSAAQLGIPATIFMPQDAALPKIIATESYGAKVELVPGNVGAALEAAQEFAARTGAQVIHPYNHPDVIAGQGTLALEIVEQLPEVKTIIVPVGGGGLAAGIAAALAKEHPHIKVVGVQAEAAASYPSSLAAGEPVTVTVNPTMADGIAVPRAGDVPFEIISRTGVEVLTVTEEQLSQAVLFAAERAKLVVEPAAAATVAALMAYPGRFAGPVVALLSGGNIDPLVLMRVIRHGLAATGRFWQFRLRLPDRPGVLAGLASVLGDNGANVMHIAHVRTALDLGLDEVEVDLQLETRGLEHCQRLAALLTQRGYRVVG